MGSFKLFVAISSYALECCDVAIAVDRQVYPHMRYRDYKDYGLDCPLDGYQIVLDDHDNPRPVYTDENAPYAYIDLGGNWVTQLLPYPDDYDDDELSDPPSHIPLEQWQADVQEWVDTLPSGLRVVVCKCHD